MLVRRLRKTSREEIREQREENRDKRLENRDERVENRDKGEENRSRACEGAALLFKLRLSTPVKNIRANRLDRRLNLFGTIIEAL
jgi:hypothetical protein